MCDYSDKINIPTFLPEAVRNIDCTMLLTFFIGIFMTGHKAF